MPHWTLWPRENPEFTTGARSPRFYWRFQVPLVLCAAALFFVPAIQRGTGVRPWGALGLVLLHLASYALDIYTALPRRFPRSFLFVDAAIDLTTGASFAIFSGRPTSALWLLAFAVPQVMAQAFAPCASILVFILALPLATAFAWDLAGWVPLNESIGVLAGIGVASSAFYAFLARVSALALDSRRSVAAERERLAAEMERRRIAQELHASLGARLTEAALWHGVAEAGSPGASHEAVSKARASVRDALEELRNSVGGLLEGGALSAEAFEARLRDRLARLCEPAGLSVRLTVQAGGPLKPSPAYHLFKLVEEAALNAVRHARASLLTVELRLDGPPEASVHDDGAGFDPKATSFGNGLRAMEAHARALGGELALESAPGRGTRVEVRSGP